MFTSTHKTFSIGLIATLFFFAVGGASYAHAQVAMNACQTEFSDALFKRIAAAQYDASLAKSMGDFIPAVTKLTTETCAGTRVFIIEGLTDAQLLGTLLDANMRSQASTPNIISSSRGGDAVLTSCFNYYGFGSVVPHLSTQLHTVVSGTILRVSGTVENLNAFPIVEGTLYIKVFKKSGDGETKNPNGPDLVDQFIAVDNITIAERGSVPVQFDWNIPSYARSGEYEIASFFTTSKRYNLMGLAFTDDVVGTTFSFNIEGEHTSGVSFDKDSVTLNGREYLFAAYAPHFSNTEPIEVTASLDNTTGQAVRVPVSWQVYRWDQQRRENLLVTESHQVLIPANGSTEVSYTVTDTAHPVYMVVLQAEYADTRSILNVRFVRDGIPGARINFPGITSFPLRAGEEVSVFACMHSMNTPVTPSNTLVVTLSDRQGREIHSTKYVGAITGEMMGMVSSFLPRRSYDYVELVAQLFTDDVLVEDARFVYDCAAIDHATCSGEAEESFWLHRLLQFAGFAAIIVMLFGFGFYALYTRRSPGGSSLQ